MMKRTRLVLAATAGVLVVAGTATAVAVAGDSAGVVVQEDLPLSPEMQRYVKDPAAFEELLRTSPPTPLMERVHPSGK
ncbi:hypothetical protein ACFVUH_27435 [Kitasatospora sp. NPDC058032]|uniref:hypothetical protein n=1 Tax=unclassified Kitasatospora TaxID=2633591 RepID=UPI0033A1A222